MASTIPLLRRNAGVITHRVAETGLDVGALKEEERAQSHNCRVRGEDGEGMGVAGAARAAVRECSQ
jgi:hypothetical protein